MRDKGKIIGTILGVILFIILISNVTYAIYTWSTTDEDKKIIGGISDCFEITYIKGDDIGSDNSIEKIELGSTYTDGKSTSIKIKINDTCNITTGNGTVYLNTTEMSDILKNSNILNYQVLDGSIEVKKGIVSNLGTVPIYENFDVNTTEKNITVYIWINGEYVDNSNYQDVLTSVYKGNITAKVESR